MFFCGTASNMLFLGWVVGFISSSLSSPIKVISSPLDSPIVYEAGAADLPPLLLYSVSLLFLFFPVDYLFFEPNLSRVLSFLDHNYEDLVYLLLWITPFDISTVSYSSIKDFRIIISFACRLIFFCCLSIILFVFL